MTVEIKEEQKKNILLSCQFQTEPKVKQFLKYISQMQNDGILEMDVPLSKEGIQLLKKKHARGKDGH